MTEREKRDAGMWYDNNYNAELLEERDRTEELCFAFNHTSPDQKEKKLEILKKIFPHMGKNVTIIAPITVDHGYTSWIGDDTFINHNAYFLDGARVVIGKHCFIGPNCGIYTAHHALIAEERNQGFETAKPVVIGDNVWIGGDVTITPGVTIGEGAVIGAKSVVTKDIPANVVAAGNPCRVIRPITEKDSIKNTGKLFEG